jgi:hypothetical protein
MGFMPDARKDAPDEYVYTTYITRGGRRIYASEYGLKAFRLKVRRKRGE